MLGYESMAVQMFPMSFTYQWVVGDETRPQFASLFPFSTIAHCLTPRPHLELITDCAAKRRSNNAIML